MKNGIIIQYEVKNPRKGDVLTFDGKSWVSTPHTLAFVDEQARILELEALIARATERIAKLEEHINTLAKATKENL